MKVRKMATIFHTAVHVVAWLKNRRVLAPLYLDRVEECSLNAALLPFRSVERPFLMHSFKTRIGIVAGSYKKSV